jgi:hypothetical protein
MANTSQKVIAGSIVVAAAVALVALVDLGLKVPFGRQVVMDVLFLIGAALTIYMGIDAYREME